MGTQPKLTMMGTSQVESCAVVGNAGHLTQKAYGKAVDSHNLVVRLRSSHPIQSEQSGAAPTISRRGDLGGGTGSQEECTQNTRQGRFYRRDTCELLSEDTRMHLVGS